MRAERGDVLPSRRTPLGSAAATADTLALRNALQRLSGADDGDALIRFEVEQMGVTRDDQIGLCRQRAGEHTVVIGVGKHGWADIGWDNLLC